MFFRNQQDVLDLHTLIHTHTPKKTKHPLEYTNTILKLNYKVFIYIYIYFLYL